MELGTIFRENEYNNAINYISQFDNLTIQEIEQDTFGRRFQIVEIPAPTAVEIALIQIGEKKAFLEKYKEDVEQVELFGMERADYEEKKKICAELILELRELEKVVANGKP